MTEAHTDEALLPCGRDAEDEWRRAGDAVSPDVHERDCPYCRAVFEQRAVLLDASAALAARADVPPAGLSDRVMRLVRLERRPSVRIAMAGTGTSTVALVADSAVVTAVRTTLDSDPSVLLRRCVVEPLDDGPGTVRVSVSLEVSFERFSTRGNVDDRVAATVRDLFGLTAAVVDVEIVDVFTERPATHP